MLQFLLFLWSVSFNFKDLWEFFFEKYASEFPFERFSEKKFIPKMHKILFATAGF